MCWVLKLRSKKRIIPLLQILTKNEPTSGNKRSSVTYWLSSLGGRISVLHYVDRVKFIGNWKFCSFLSNRWKNEIMMSHRCFTRVQKLMIGNWCQLLVRAQSRSVRIQSVIIILGNLQHRFSLSTKSSLGKNNFNFYRFSLDLIYPHYEPFINCRKQSHGYANNNIFIEYLSPPPAFATR